MIPLLILAGATSFSTCQDLPDLPRANLEAVLRSAGLSPQVARQDCEDFSGSAQRIAIGFSKPRAVGQTLCAIDEMRTRVDEADPSHQRADPEDRYPFIRRWLALTSCNRASKDDFVVPDYGGADLDRLDRSVPILDKVLNAHGRPVPGVRLTYENRSTRPLVAQISRRDIIEISTAPDGAVEFKAWLPKAFFPTSVSFDIHTGQVPTVAVRSETRDLP